MKSNKQRRAELKFERRMKKAKRDANRQKPMGHVPINRAALRPMCYWPAWVERGFYLDHPFACKDCGALCVWPARRQKWWYEVMKAHPDTTAVRCKPCRVKERSRKAVAQQHSQPMTHGKHNPINGVKQI